VKVVGDFLPRTIFGKCYAACAYLRSLVAAIYLLFFASLPQPDVVFVDQISAPNFLLKLFRRQRVKILFYCHHPDLLLCTRRDSWLKRLYRRPIDKFEEYTTGLADCILVNSNFTGIYIVFTRNFSLEIACVFSSKNVQTSVQDASGHRTTGAVPVCLQKYD